MRQFKPDNFKRTVYLIVGILAIAVALGAYFAGGRAEKPFSSDSVVTRQDAPAGIQADGFHALKGKVVRVPDGDTVYLKTADGREIRIRLLGIDAPEGKMPYGEQSRDHLYGMLKRSQFRVDVVYKQHDQYGRIVGKLVSDGRDLNLAQLRDGYAWVYRSYVRDLQRGDKNQYFEAERAAKENRLGLWRDPNPQKPWEWRREHPRSEP